MAAWCRCDLATDSANKSGSSTMLRQGSRAPDSREFWMSSALGLATVPGSRSTRIWAEQIKRGSSATPRSFRSVVGCLMRWA